MTELPRAGRLLGFVLAALLAVPLLHAQRLDVPPPSGEFVTDLAGLLSPSERGLLETKLRAYRDTTSTQIVVLIVKDLGGVDPFTYALEVGRQWGVGQADVDNGVVVLVSREDRKIQIATGYGLEGAIPDAVASRIIRNILTPNFRQGQFFNGLNEATDALILAARGEYTAEAAPDDGSEQGIDAATLFILLILLFFVIRAIRHRGGGGPGGKRYRSSWGGPPVVIWGGGGGHGGGGFGGGFGGGGFGGGGFSGGGGGFGGGGAGGGW